MQYRVFLNPGAKKLGETQRKNVFIMFDLKENGLPMENFVLVCCPRVLTLLRLQGEVCSCKIAFLYLIWFNVCFLVRSMFIGHTYLC